jgi:hypothetical protein
MDYTHLQAQAYQSLARCQYLDAQAFYEQCIDIQPQEQKNYWYLGLSLLLLEQLTLSPLTDKRCSGRFLFHRFLSSLILLSNPDRTSP